MTDIEKRAYNYAEAIYGDTEKDIEWSIARDGYEFGAKRQLKIDIEKACEAFREQIGKLNDDYAADIQNEDVERMINDFLSAMEGGNND